MKAERKDFNIFDDAMVEFSFMNSLFKSVEPSGIYLNAHYIGAILLHKITV